VSVCLRLVFASCGAVSVCLVCVLNVSRSDVQLGKYADANGRVSMDVWESSSVEHRGFQNFHENAEYELKAKTNKQKNRKVFNNKYIFKNINIHNREEATRRIVKHGQKTCAKAKTHRRGKQDVKRDRGGEGKTQEKTQGKTQHFSPRSWPEKFGPASGKRKPMK